MHNHEEIKSSAHLQVEQRVRIIVGVGHSKERQLQVLLLLLELGQQAVLVVVQQLGVQAGRSD